MKANWPPGRRTPPHLGHGRNRVGHDVHDEARDHQVEGRVGELERGRVHQMAFDCREVAREQFDHPRSGVDRDHPACPLGEHPAQRAAPGRQVKDLGVRRQVGAAGDLAGEAREERDHLVVDVRDAVEVFGYWARRHDATVSREFPAGH